MAATRVSGDRKASLMAPLSRSTIGAVPTGATSWSRQVAVDVRIQVAVYLDGTTAVTSISIIMPGQASWLMVRSVW